MAEHKKSESLPNMLSISMHMELMASIFFWSSIAKEIEKKLFRPGRVVKGRKKSQKGKKKELDG